VDGVNRCSVIAWNFRKLFINSFERLKPPFENYIQSTIYYLNLNFRPFTSCSIAWLDYIWSSWRSKNS
jgi:hypothetical protein